LTGIGSATGETLRKFYRRVTIVEAAATLNKNDTRAGTAWVKRITTLREAPQAP
jgi:hypothetical protein